MNYGFLNRQIIYTLISLLLVIILFEISNIDLNVQNYFYNFSTNKWLIDRDNPILKFIFYDGIKILLISFLVILFLSAVFFRKKTIIQKYKKGIILVVASGVIIPSLVGALKYVTNLPCPRNIENFQGNRPYVKIFDNRLQNNENLKRSRCWPAGHSSGGFALLSLFFLFKTVKAQKISILFALTIGWLMGLYKMMIGDHFLSHTIVTMILAWLVILLVRKTIIFLDVRYGI